MDIVFRHFINKDLLPIRLQTITSPAIGDHHFPGLRIFEITIEVCVSKTSELSNTCCLAILARQISNQTKGDLTVVRVGERS